MHIAYQISFVAIGVVGFASMLQSSLNSTSLRTNAAILEVADPNKLVNFIATESTTADIKAANDAADVLFAQTRQKTPRDEARLRALTQHEMSTEGLRVAVFGSSNAWGASLEDRFTAYPFLLSPRVHNYAHYAAGPNYYATCLETVLGDDNIYDVIILDYWLKYHEGLSHLARRLRQRFPHAILIFLKLWSPIHFHQKPDESADEDYSFANWKTNNGLDGADLQTVIDAIDGDSGYWYFPDHPNADGGITEIAYQQGGYTFAFPFKPEEQGGVKATLSGYLGLYDEFAHAHVSVIGHEAIARNIKHIVNTNNAKSHEDLVNGQIHGNFGAGDSCHMFYSTGMASSIELYGDLTLTEYDTHAGKFAIEVVGDGMFTVENPFGNERPLYLSFLTSSVAGTYSNATVSYDNWQYELDPFNNEDLRHEVKTEDIGMIPSGQHNITVTLNSEPKLFRIVGLSFSDGTAVPLKYGFGPNYHHTS